MARALDIPPHWMTLQGFGAMERTILDEVLGFRPDFINPHLAHAAKASTAQPCHRTSLLPERRVMMQAWANHLEQLQTGETESGT